MLLHLYVWHTHARTLTHTKTTNSMYASTYYMITHTVSMGRQLLEYNESVCFQLFRGAVIFSLKMCLLSQNNSCHSWCLSRFSHLLHLSNCSVTVSFSYFSHSFFYSSPFSFLPLPNWSYLLYHNLPFIFYLVSPSLSFFLSSYIK